MRIPPYYRRPSWQRFFAGMAIGGAISWCIFIYIFGVWQEKHTALIDKQSEKIIDLENEKKIWQEEYKEINKRTIEQLTTQKINVKIINGEKYKLDMLSVSEIEDSVKDDISMMLAKDIDTVYKSKELIKKIIQNKPVKLNDKRYKLKVKEMVIFTTLSIQLEIEFEQ
ncbi:sporulation membrane protein YtrI [Neobacillus sp. 179-C4.2 HS]|uniref:Sporulation membrane protein YtrI n=1 Tax=Neobacillus driksii TaxID=3035913 RepID=A0ABV4YLB7_9BACI|nr:sporulation membrane protein YtrI [Neobacillus sp. 179.-C4.2 HS]MDP5196325.1 sporulation protein [Neobacillus sp. 179.-C4.2 HS]